MREKEPGTCGEEEGTGGVRGIARGREGTGELKESGTSGQRQRKDRGHAVTNAALEGTGNCTAGGKLSVASIGTCQLGTGGGPWPIDTCQPNVQTNRASYTGNAQRPRSKLRGARELGGCEIQVTLAWIRDLYGRVDVYWKLDT